MSVPAFDSHEEVEAPDFPNSLARAWLASQGAASNADTHFWSVFSLFDPGPFSLSNLANSSRA